MQLWRIQQFKKFNEIEAIQGIQSQCGIRGPINHGIMENQAIQEIQGNSRN